MAVSASEGMQPWIRTTEARQSALEKSAINISYQLDLRAAPDKPVFKDGAPYTGPANVAGTHFPPNSSVVHTNTTGLIEVTVSATLRNSKYGGSGVGVFFDELSPTLLNGVPKYGVSYKTDISETVTGASYTSVFSVRPGTREIGLYYFTDNNSGNGATASIDMATIIVRSV